MPQTEIHLSESDLPGEYFDKAMKPLFEARAKHSLMAACAENAWSPGEIEFAWGLQQRD